MAKLPALISALAKSDDRERATIEHVARVIRESGYIPTTKRGRGSANMTSREAVNLLLGANGADAPKDAPLAIDRFRSLRLHTNSSDHGEPLLDVFRDVAKCENFGIALEELIDGMQEVLIAAGNLIDAGYQNDEARSRYVDGLITKAEMDALDQDDVRSHFKHTLLERTWRDPPIKLIVELHRYSAKISCETWVGNSIADARWRNEFTASFIADGRRLVEGFYGNFGSDRSVAVSVSGLTLLRLYRAISDDADARETDCDARE